MDFKIQNKLQNIFVMRFFCKFNIVDLYRKKFCDGLKILVFIYRTGKYEDTKCNNDSNNAVTHFNFRNYLIHEI